MADIASAMLPPAATAQMPRPTPDPASTAREFEAVFVGQMTKLMMEMVDTGDFSGGAGEEMFRGVLAEQMGNEIAKRGGIGLAPAVLDQIIRMQGGSGHGQ
ncbi:MULTISPECIES: rod-binding protein [Sphingomonadales]|uniref:Flagellar biosynthesis protein FlgJ n=2 Tax=Edaphosphingomonas TaxID=3423724 RepID=A0A2T4I776_9SPHN|nr:MULTISPECIES: rod-binding protein [Sphingomonas]AGH49039.1 chemotactic signal-response protein [Sphingomonas sp. MM-1]MDX3885295.1 rod-binding protein [Sphingomonas sp.]OHT21461.1 chemotactic signal-response protein CheL [Sphingomonas haloaromaticamans]PTD26944.1 flagellar biosynthesis protein FlgJ [Sphingomonas fennica]